MKQQRYWPPGPRWRGCTLSNQYHGPRCLPLHSEQSHETQWENLEDEGDGALASVLVSRHRVYLVLGKVKDANTSGPLFDKMNEELAKLKMSARCVWTIEPVEVWDQSASPKAGTKIA